MLDIFIPIVQPCHIPMHKMRVLLLVLSLLRFMDVYSYACSRKYDIYFLEGDGIQVLQCPLCKSGFKKQATLTEHIARKHATNKPFKVLYSK